MSATQPRAWALQITESIQQLPDPDALVGSVLDRLTHDPQAFAIVADWAGVPLPAAKAVATLVLPLKELAPDGPALDAVACSVAFGGVKSAAGAVVVLKALGLFR